MRFTQYPRKASGCKSKPIDLTEFNQIKIKMELTKKDEE